MYTLILTIIISKYQYGSAVSMIYVPGYRTEADCIKAGKDWRSSITSVDNTLSTYCSRQ